MTNTLSTFQSKVSTLSTDSLLTLIQGLIDEEVFNQCFDIAVDEACNRNPDLAFQIEQMMN